MEFGKIENNIIKLEYNGIGFIFKSQTNFDKKEGICYVAEFGVDEDKTVANSDTYTYNDLFQLVSEFIKRNEIMTANIKDVTRDLFEALEWQSPSTIIDEWEIDDIFEK